MQGLTGQELATQAKALQANKLLPAILKTREAALIDTWRLATNTEERESAWQALRQLDLLAGAIEDAIREHTD